MADLSTPPGSPDVNGVVRFYEAPASPMVVLLTPPASPTPRSEDVLVLETPSPVGEENVADRPHYEVMVVPETPPAQQRRRQMTRGLDQCRRRLDFQE